jgi:hypothetical protein
VILIKGCSMPEGGVWGGVLFGILFLFMCSLRSGEARIQFRSWIPSWRFYDQTGVTWRMQFRPLRDEGSEGPWRDVNPWPQPRAFALVYFPEGNEFHAFETLLKDFAQSPEDPDLSALLIGEAAARAQVLSPHSLGFEFRLLRYSPESGHSEPVWSQVWNSPRS